MEDQEPDANQEGAELFAFSDGSVLTQRGGGAAISVKHLLLSGLPAVSGNIGPPPSFIYSRALQ